MYRFSVDQYVQQKYDRLIVKDVENVHEFVLSLKFF